MRRTAWRLLVLGFAGLAGTADLSGQGLLKHDTGEGLGIFDDPLHLEALTAKTCAGGMAAEEYPCAAVDLESFVPIHDMLPDGHHDELAQVSDVWGWRDPKTGREWALVGLSNGTAFVDVTRPREPRVAAFMPTSTVGSPWREIRTYRDFALVIADAAGTHGLQVFKLERLRKLRGERAVVPENVRWAGFGSAHNLHVNERTGTAFVVGSSDCTGGGILMVDVRQPGRPRALACHAWPDQPYVHDLQCVTYQGPHRAYRGREVCFASTGDALWVLDVTQRSAPRTLARLSYPGIGYAHQGWLTPDHAYFLMDDELDERASDGRTRTLLWDVRNLTAPVQFAVHEHDTSAVDHNQFVAGRLSFQANYHAGLRILDLRDLRRGELREIGHFDVSPQTDTNESFGGAWGVYPFLPSGNVLVSSIDRGLYVLRPSAAIRQLARTRSGSGAAAATGIE